MSPLPTVSSASDDAPPPSNASMVRWRRRLLWALLVFAVLVAIGPWLAGAPPIRNAIAARLSNELHADVRIGSLKCGWLSQLTLRDVVVQTREGQPVLAIQGVQTSKNLLGLIGADKGEIEILRPSVTMHMREKQSNLQDLADAMADVDPRSGLLGLLFHPDRDLNAQIHIRSASFHAMEVTDQSTADQVEALLQDLLDSEVDTEATETPPIARDVSLDVTVSRRLGDTVVELSPGRVLDRARVTPELCDFGLKYVAPILANTTDMDGVISLDIDACRIPVKHLDSAVLEGVVHVETLESEVQSPLLRKVVVTLGRLLNRPDPGRLFLADNSEVRFHAQNGRIHHESLEFGLPKLSQELTIATTGSVGFDQSLDVVVHVPLPFELLGESELLSRLGETDLNLSVGGTLSQPKIGLPDDGSLVNGLVKAFVKTNNETRSTPAGDREEPSLEEELAPLLEGLGDAAVDAIRKFRDKRKNRDGEDDSDPKSKDGQLNRIKRGLGKLLKKLQEDGGD